MVVLGHPIKIPANQKEVKKQFSSLLSEARSLLSSDIEKSEKLVMKALGIAEAANDNDDLALCNLSLGLIYERKNELEVALEFYKKALSLSEKGNSEEGKFYSLRAIGGIHYKKTNYPRALDYFLEAQKGEISSLDNNQVYLNISSIVEIYARLGDYLKAYEYASIAIPIVRIMGNQDYEKTTISALDGLRNVIRNNILKTVNEQNINLGSNSPEKAKGIAEAALAAANIINDSECIALCSLALGMISQSMGMTDEGVMYFREVQRLGRVLPNRIAERLAFMAIINLYMNTHNYTKLKEAAKEYYDFARDIQDKRLEHESGLTLGRAYLLESEYSKALAVTQSTLELSKQLADDELERQSLELISIIYKNVNDYENAFYYLYQSQKLASKSNDPKSIIENNEKLGKMHYLAGNYDNALVFYNAALTGAQKINDINKERYLVTLIGNTYLYSRKFKNALDYLMRSVKAYEATGNLGMQANIHADLADCYLGIGDANMAISHAKRAIEINESTDLAHSNSLPLLLAGIGYIRKAEYEEAKRYLTLCAELEDTAAKNIDDLDIRTRYYEKSDRVYEFLLYASMQKIDKKNKDKIREIYELFEKSRARGLLDLLSGVKTGTRIWLDRGLQEYEDALYRNIGNIRKNAKNVTDPAETKNILDKMVAAQLELESIKDKLRRTNPKYAAIKYHKILSVNDVQEKILTFPDQAVVEYYVGQEYSYLYLITKKQYACIELKVTNQELTAKIREVRKPFELIKKGSSIISEMSQLNYGLLYELYKLLLYPAVPYLKGINKLIIIPSGALYYLPFEMLLYGAPQDASKSFRPTLKEFNKFLIEKYEISYAPSASIVGLYLAENGQIRKYIGDFLAFADPSFYESKLRNKEGSESSQLLSRGVENSLEPLPYAIREVDDIAKNFKTPLILKEEQASKKNFISYATEYPIIHVASHGYIDELNPAFSGIAFSFEQNINQVGVLSTYEIFKLNLNCEIVTLSACESGVGQDIEAITGEGVLGLSRAFLYAGARSLLVSQWTISDESTSIIMSEFYRNLKQNKMSKANALRRAKLYLMKQTKKIGNIRISYSHPFFWAPFVLIGNPN
jgi:CHAT domain-containing protein